MCILMENRLCYSELTELAPWCVGFLFCSHLLFMSTKAESLHINRRIWFAALYSDITAVYALLHNFSKSLSWSHKHSIQHKQYKIHIRTWTTEERFAVSVFSDLGACLYYCSIVLIHAVQYVLHSNTDLVCFACKKWLAYCSLYICIVYFETHRMW